MLTGAEILQGLAVAYDQGMDCDANASASAARKLGVTKGSNYDYLLRLTDEQ